MPGTRGSREEGGGKVGRVHDLIFKYEKKLECSIARSDGYMIIVGRF